MFSDVAKQWWPRIARLVKLGIINGIGGGRLGSDINKLQVALMIDRTLDVTLENFTYMIPEVDPALVTITSDAGLGSGTIVSPQGFILTNAHVVGELKQVRVFNAVIDTQGEVVYVEPDNDLALVRIEGGTPVYLKLCNPDEIVRGTPVLVVGSPLGLVGTVTQGIVSFAGRAISKTYADMVQTDAAINSGNSGGAMIDRHGHLIGVPSAKLKGEAIDGLNFAIGLRTVDAFLNRATDKGLLAMSARGNLLTIA